MVSNKTPQDPYGFAPEIRQIEQEIVEFFAEKAFEFIGRHPIVATVMTYFDIRRSLTQQDLRKLTGFSAGTISKSVRQLVDMNVITKETIPGTHKHIYKMEKLPFTSARYFLRTEKLLEEMEKELKEMKVTLDTHADEMKDLKGYRKIYTIITQLLELISTTPMFMTLIDEEIGKFIKENK
jgi:DNA-binding transcriptional regulator GbsR (MarR family)